MGNTTEYQYGPVIDYSTKMNMSSDAGREWTWGVWGLAPIAAINNVGNMEIAGSFKVGADIVLPSVNGNKQIYTGSGTDSNWRIGMSTNPGFTTSMTTSHVQ